MTDDGITLAYCRMPYEDELYYHYIYDLFLWNRQMPYFEVDRLLGSHTAILAPANLSDVCMGIRNVTFLSLSDLVSMTPVGILMDGLPERKAAKLCEGVIQPAGAAARSVTRDAMPWIL